VGRQEQDLSELLDKRAKEKEQRQARVSVRPPLPGPSPNTPLAGARGADHFQTRHRPLNHLLGTPTGHHGRAVVPAESPFELRQKVNENPGDRTDSRPPKRRKCDFAPPTKMGYAQNLFGATLSLSAVPVSSAPPRRPTGSAYRAQPETSSPPEESMPNVRPLGQSREFASGIELQEGSSRARAVAPPSRTPLEPDSSAVLEDRESPEAASRTLGPSHPGKAILGGHGMSAQRSAGIGQHRLTSFSNGRPPTAASKPTIASAMPGIGRDKLAQDRQPALVVNLSEGDHSARGTAAPSLGASRSQAIALDEDENRRPDALAQVSERRKAAEKTGSVRVSANTEKRKPIKRSRLLQSAAKPSVVELATTATPSDVEEPAQEERTELRLKPRQKRGLLMLSEKRNKPKQPKRQVVPASGRISRESPEPPADTVMREPSLAFASPCSAPQQENPFASPPAAPRNPPHRIRREAENTDCIPPHAAADLSEPEEPRVDPPASPKPPEPAYDSSDKAKDETVTLSSSPSPRATRVRSRRKASVRTREELSETSSLDLEESSADAAPKPTQSRPSRRTRKKKNMDDQESGRSKKKVRTADSGDSDSEELPRAPARPHLAKLSRKSVRSREVFGFVPSSSPITNVNLLRPSFGASGPDPPNNDAGVTTCLAEPISAEPPASIEAQHSKEEGLISSLPTDTPQAASFALQPQIPLAKDGKGEQMIEESREERTPTSTAPQSVGPTKRPSLACHASTVSPESVIGSNKPAPVSIPDPEHIAAPEKETTPTTTMLKRESPTAVGSMTLRPQFRNFPEQPAHPMNDTPDIRPDSCVTEHAKGDPPIARTAETSRPRIANPATRGRKAALKSHAAGQVPLSIIPADPVPARVVVGMQQPPAMPRADPAAPSGRLKRTMRFPGFASAKGAGPWSREAHDLLESARPC
jgi:hypothetical protein